MELLRYKNRDTNIPKRDTKENVPDGSWRQEKKISNMCRRQDKLLGEERVAKLGHVAVGEWCPDSGNVEVIVEKGKFWQTMGFHLAGKKWLRPSEALYLLETCSLDLHFHGITMSVQEAYDVLIPKMVSMEYYQVYSYLMRLGYIIDEHKGFTFSDHDYRTCFNRYGDTKDQAVKKVEDWFQQMDPSAQTSKVSFSDSGSESARSGSVLANKYAKVEALPKKAVKSNVDYTLWNFKEISLPNLQETVDRIPIFQSVLSKMLSSQPKESQENSQEFPGTSRLFWDPEPNLRDPANEPLLVIGNIDSPRNWGEYKLLKKQDKELYPLHGSPVRHLWEGDVHPLVKPSDALTTSNLLHKLQTIQNVNVASHFAESCEFGQDTNIDFNIYLPESNYKKTSPGKPVFYVIVTKLQEEPPNLLTQIQLLRQAGGTPLVWAVVDNGDISFYTLRDIELPIGLTT